MRLSTAGRYGLRALVDLITHHEGTPVSLASIAERQQISMGYLEHMFSILKKAGLVQSARGSQGGYHPVAGLGNKTAGEVLRVLEGDLNVMEPGAQEDDPIRQCLRQQLWDALDRGIAETVDDVTLDSLAGLPAEEGERDEPR